MGSADRSSPERAAPAKVSSWQGHGGGGVCLRGNERLRALAGLGCPWGSKWVPGSHLGGEAEHTDGEHVGVCEWHMAGDGWHGNSV